jgi:acyl-CoA thioesterase
VTPAADFPFAPPGPLADLLGIRADKFDDGRAVFALTVRRDHMNPYGVVHGGVVYSLVDTAMGAALVSRLRDGERCATLEIKINYLAAATGGELRADAAVVERTTRIGVLQARVHGDGERLIALATGTFYITPGAGG